MTDDKKMFGMHLMQTVKFVLVYPHEKYNLVWRESFFNGKFTSRYQKKNLSESHEFA